MATDRTKAARAIRQILEAADTPIDPATAERIRDLFNRSLEGPETAWKVPVILDDDRILVLDLTINEGEN